MAYAQMEDVVTVGAARSRSRRAHTPWPACLGAGRAGRAAAAGPVRRQERGQGGAGQAAPGGARWPGQGQDDGPGEHAGGRLGLRAGGGANEAGGGCGWAHLLVCHCSAQDSTSPGHLHPGRRPPEAPRAPPPPTGEVHHRLLCRRQAQLCGRAGLLHGVLPRLRLLRRCAAPAEPRAQRRAEAAALAAAAAPPAKGPAGAPIATSGSP
jgi:hypothetical protein